MPKKGEKLSAEQLAKMQAGRKKQPPVPTPEINETFHQQDDVDELKRQIAELKDNQSNFMLQMMSAMQSGKSTQQTGQLTDQGQVGWRDRYIVDPDHYPNPVERLYDEKKLARWNMRANYEITYNMDVVQYENITKIRMQEPKFTLTLLAYDFDEITGEPKGKFVVRKGIFHEDPQAAMIIAREQGLSVDQENEKLFLDEMRYIRFRDWLFESFYPVPVKAGNTFNEIVIGNQLVQYFEVSSENRANLASAFDKLDNSLKT